MKVKYIGKLIELGLVYNDIYEVVEGPDQMGNVTIIDQFGSPLWLLSTEVETVIDTITLPVITVEPGETEGAPLTPAQKQLKVLKDHIAELSKQAELLERSL